MFLFKICLALSFLFKLLPVPELGYLFESIIKFHFFFFKAKGFFYSSIRSTHTKSSSFVSSREFTTPLKVIFHLFWTSRARHKNTWNAITDANWSRMWTNILPVCCFVVIFDSGITSERCNFFIIRGPEILFNNPFLL